MAKRLPCPLAIVPFGCMVFRMERSEADRFGLSQTLTRYLAERNLSLREVVEQTQIPLTTLHRKLAGRADFRLDELTALARMLDTPLSELISESERVA